VTVTAPASREDLRFRRDIEGLRAVAVIAVVAYHAGWLSGGYVGVDVFFVVSGFLITRLLLDEMRHTGRLSFAAFYARRARRLLPASVLVLVFTVVASWIVLSPLQMRTVAGDAKGAALYVANYRFAAQRTNYLGPHGPSPVQHYWSLGVEEQFYLLWPLLLFVLVRFGRRVRTPAILAIVVVVSFVWSARLTVTNQPWAFFSLPTRLWELAAGGLLAFAATRLAGLRPSVATVVGWGGLAVIAWSMIRYSASTSFPGFAALAPVLGTVAVIGAGCAAARKGPIVMLRQPLAQLIGRSSYAWYLWHWPILVLAAAWVARPLSTVQTVALVALSAGLALLTTVAVERPIRTSRLLSWRPRRSFALAAGLTGVALFATYAAALTIPDLRGHGTAAVLSPQLPLVAPDARGKPPTTVPPLTRVLDQVDTKLLAALHVNAMPENVQPPLGRAAADKATPFVDGCDNTYTDAVVHECAYAATDARTTIVLFGDSHATQYFPAFDFIARVRHWRLVVLSKTTCPPFELTLFSPVLDRTYSECDAWREAAFARIARERPALVVLGAARHYDASYHFSVYGPEWLAGIHSSIERIRQMGVPVMVLGPTPKPPFDVPSCVSGHLNDVQACATPITQAVNVPGRQAERSVAVGAGARYVDVSHWMCLEQTCPAIVGNLLVYRDDNHLTTGYAAWLTPVIDAEVELAMTRSPATRVA
jgi:peptidoglycan/LPS O-acetylase OafA/YrhL